MKFLDEKINAVNNNWSKDLIIRYLNNSLAPYFRGDLSYYLATDEEQLKMYQNGFKINGPNIVCKTLSEFYAKLYHQFDINAHVVTVTNNKVPLYCLVVEGEKHPFYISPTGDLFTNQYGLFPIYFGNMSNWCKKALFDEYPKIQNLKKEYIEELDQELGINHLDNYFQGIRKWMKVDGLYRKQMGIDKTKNQLDVILSKLEFLNSKLINLGHVNGLYERLQVYNYLFGQLFNRLEVKHIKAQIVSLNGLYQLLIQIQKENNLLEFEEIKEQETFIIKKYTK